MSTRHEETAVPPEGAYTIGLQQVYEELRRLSDRLHEYMGRQDAQGAAFDVRLATVEKALTEVQTQLEAERASRAATSRQVGLALLSSLVFPVIVTVTAGLIR